MPVSFDEMFEQYERKLEAEIGPLEVGQFARWRRSLVERFDRDTFERHWREFKELEATYRSVIASGATATNELYDEVRERAAQLLLAESNGSFWW